MESWIAEVVRLAMERAPDMTCEHAFDLADDLYRAWPENKPAEAVAWFFALMPAGWNAEAATA